MKVAFDMQLAVGTATGIGVYQRDLLAALRAAGVDVQPLQAPWLDPWRFDRRVLWDQVLLPAQAARSAAGVLHATAGTLPAATWLPTVVTVHDLAWLRVQGHTRFYARAYFGSLMPVLYRRAAAVVTDSAFSKGEFLALVGERAGVHVVAPGVDARFARLARRPRERPLALAVGTVERRKNLLLAVDAVAPFPELDLIAVGPPTPYRAEVEARIAALGIGERVALRGYVGGTELDVLYASATVALVPSLYEGFGYALAEAMCAGLPVLANRNSSLVEVAGADVPLLEPQPAEWSEALGAVLRDRDAAERHAAALRPRAVERFAWSTAANALTGVYASVG